MRTFETKIKILDPKAVIPHKAHHNDACYDVYAVSKEKIGDSTYCYGLGFALESHPNYRVSVRARSSVYKTGMILANCVGIGDPGYRGEYKMVFYHLDKSLPTYEVGERIGQISLEEVINMKFVVATEFAETTRGDGGFGSTGK